MTEAYIDYSHALTTGTQVNGEIYISLRDNTTGLPVNGNGAVVAYQQDINGASSNSVVTIETDTAKIYTGRISDSNPNSYYYSSFSILSFTPGSADPPPGPPATPCDLVITGITLDNPESTAAAADGQFTIQATSSYGPLQYSNDFGTTWQSSPTFGGLLSGLQQPLAKDSNPNNCTQQNVIYIPISPNRLASGPDVTLPGGNVSRWNAAFNPIVFTYQRKDLEVQDVQPDPVTGKAILHTNFALRTSYINDVAYINAGPYKGQYKILAATDFVTTLTIDTPFVGTATGFVNINRMCPYYQVQTRITYQDPLTGQTNTITSTNRPDSTGLTRADLSSFLQSLVQARDNSDYTQVNHHDTYLSASYQVAYTESWDGKLADGAEPNFIALPNPYYVLYAAKQLGDKYGGNLAAYVPFRAIPTGLIPAKWVTDFAESAYSNQYPFDISFIYGEDLLGLDLYCESLPLDINRNPIGAPQTSYLLNEDTSWLLNQDGSRLIITAQGSVNTPVPAQLGLNRLLVNSNFADDVYYFNVTLKYNEGDVSHSITQTQTIRVDKAPDENSVYLRWVGLTGSWNYYRFIHNQEVSLDVQNATIIKNYVSDWENQQGIEEVIGKSAGQKMKVMAEDLSVADIKGLQSIKYSPKVQLLVSKNPVKWQTIVLNTATFAEYETLNGHAPFSVTFNLPSINIQTQ